MEIRKKFFTERTHWKRFPREVADALTLAVFKSRLHKALVGTK